ncbi:hypothetical protein [Oryzobacter terrae]|uniref:hypothetical protein n=1 Tax=Oryzobacter terrae TaxID=1620385 RepID=UPI003672D1E1
MGDTRRRTPWVVALAAATAVLAPAAVADEGLATGATSRYVVDAKRTTVEATITIELRNVTPDRGDTYYFYNEFSVPVPAGAEKARARSNGTSLPVSLSRTEDASTRLARISFPNLLYGRSRTIELTFEVPGEAPRSEDSTRVGRGYASFAVYGVGDVGRNTVEVVAPSSMSFDATSEAFSASAKGSTTTHTARSSDPDGGFFAVVSLRDPKQADERTVEVAGTTLVLRGFRDDPRWVDFVADRVTAGVPVLERLVGNPWPGGLERIREDTAPSVYGYDGWFDPSDDEIVVGEQFDADLIFHELSHAWLQGDRFAERWVSEGLAQVVAERTVVATGGKARSHPSVSPSSKDALPLNEWGGSADDRSGEIEAFAYPASYRATRDLTRRLDDEAFAAVVGAAVRGERAYDPAGTRDPDSGRTTWARWFDLLETRAGVDAAAVFSRWALTDDERENLPVRARERTAYAALDEADGAWLPPEGLRDAMTAWDFERAATVRGQVAALGARAVAVQQAAEATATEVPDVIRTSYEAADQPEQYAALAASLPKAATAVRAVGEAERAASADRDPLSELGAALLGVDDRTLESVGLLGKGRLDEAAAVADDAKGRADTALLVGVAVPLLTFLLLVGALLLARRVVAGRRPRAAARGAERRRLLEASGGGQVVPADWTPQGAAPVPAPHEVTPSPSERA